MNGPYVTRNRIRALPVLTCCHQCCYCDIGAIVDSDGVADSHSVIGVEKTSIITGAVGKIFVTE